MRTSTRARVRVISSYETLCVVRSLVCVRTRTRDAPRRRRRVTIERSRRGASGGALAVGTPPPRARARFLVASFFFFSPFSPIAISRSRDLARDGWRRRSRESRESRYGSFQSSDWSRLEAWDPSMSYDSSHGETRVGRAGLRIEGKNDDTDVNLQGSDFDARASAGVEDARRTRARVVELRFDGSIAFIKLRLAAPSASY